MSPPAKLSAQPHREASPDALGVATFAGLAFSRLGITPYLIRMKANS
jgi:hypothetical protein